MTGLSFPPLFQAGLLLGAISLPAYAASETVLYSFKGGPDGAAPAAGLVSAGGKLYGTTSGGGSAGHGVVYSVTPGGSEAIVYSFLGGNDGAGPNSGLTHVGKRFYGTSFYGGSTDCGGSGCGTAFSVTLDGSEKVLHAFGPTDGIHNTGSGLTYFKNRLYGVGGAGGADASGVIFSLSLAGAESILYSFKGAPDGQEPAAGLIDVSGTFYGVTYYGGAGYQCSNGRSGCGTVFSISPAGNQKTLYSFGGGSDGSSPGASLVHAGGIFYGTTSGGGSSDAGTAFKLTPAGVETVLHDFSFGGQDGNGPVSRLIPFKGGFYGTTYGGGGTGCGGFGCGIVFRVTAKGTEDVVYAFKGGADGGLPSGDLIRVGSDLYGTTSQGGGTGCGGSGCGTVFKVSP